LALESRSLSPGSTRPAVRVWALLGLALALGGCLELIRRPISQAGTDGSAPLDTMSAAETSAAVKQVPPPMGPTPAELASARAASQDRSRDARQRVQRVNEYVHWCLERDLWAEARTHLEQALARDSLAASLHNNLGIVHEQQGRAQQALAAYESAWQLQPKKAYRANLRLLRERLEASERPEIPDSLRVEHEEGPAAAGNANRGADADSAAAHQIQR